MWMARTLVDANGAMIELPVRHPVSYSFFFLDLDRAEIGSNEGTDSKSLPAETVKNLMEQPQTEQTSIKHKQQTPIVHPSKPI
jgi:hypothetical protein